MTTKLTRNIRVLSASILFTAVLTVLITSAAPAQQTGKGPSSARASGASVPPTASTPLAYSHRIKPEVAPGDPLFLPAVAYKTGGSGYSIAVMDVNSDGKPDLVVGEGNVAGGGPAIVAVLLGNGDGTFQAALTYGSDGGVSTFYNSLVGADVNGDGKPDVVAASCAPAQFLSCVGYNFVGVLLGNGDGTAQSLATYDPGGFGADSVAVADLNGDGKPDLVVALSLSGAVGVLLGNGDGTFQSAVTYGEGGSNGGAVAIADVNGDGKPDLVLANCSFTNSLCPVGSVSVLLGNGDGTFQPAVSFKSGGYGADSVAVADVNGDGKLDLVVANWCVSGLPRQCSPGAGSVGILLGNGDGTFQSVVTYDPGGDLVTSLAVADVNGDGKPDVVVTNQTTVGVLLGNGDGTFQPAVTYGPGVPFQSPASVTLADVNGDGRPDLLVAIPNGGGLASVGVLLNNTGPHTPTTTTLASSQNPVGVHNTVTYTATVAAQSGDALTGTVTFYDGGTAIATVQLVGNQGACSASYRAVGSHAITASYSGDLHFSVSTSAVLTENVDGPSRTAVATSGSPSSEGQPVTFTATVTSYYGTIPNGELVTFYDDGTAIGTGTTASGVAAFTTSLLTAKTHTVKATYAGDVTFLASSGTVTQIVVGYPTSTTIASSLNPSIYGQTVTWTATVTNSGPVAPTGTVSFNWSIYTIGSAKLNASGVAILTLHTLNTDTYPLVAVYKGDLNNASSTSAILTQVIAQATSSATLSSSPNPSTLGQAVTFTAKITSPTVVPTGPVTFKVGNTVLGTAQLSAGKATFTTSTLAVGSTIVTVTYPWNSNITSSSASVTQTVQQ